MDACISHVSGFLWTNSLSTSTKKIHMSSHSTMEETKLKPLEENDTLLTRMQKFAMENPDRAAYIFFDKELNQRVITRQGLWDNARKFAAILKRKGLGKGDIICNTLTNSPERLFTYFGTIASGATQSQGQVFMANGEDLIHNLTVSKSKAIIYDPNDQNGARHILERIRFTDETTGEIRYKGLPNLTHVIEIEAKGLEESQRLMHLLDKEDEMFVHENITEDDTAMIFVTSGTTGFSKLVPHSHSTLLTAVHGVTVPAQLNEDTILFNMQSFGWIGGFLGYYPTLGCIRIAIDLTNGLSEKMPLGSYLLNVFNKTNVNGAFLITRDVQYVLDAMDQDHLQMNNMFESLYTGGGPIHNATMEALGKLSRRVIVAYGGSEFLIVSLNIITNKSDFQDMCTGSPINCEVKVVGDNEEMMPTGEQGEIYMRSGTVFKGYLNEPERTATAFADDGWYRTGDMGYFNKDGHLFVLCRKADAITKDGFVHYPGWMEALINKHPAIQSSLVIGIPHPVYNEEMCLCMKFEPGAEVSIDDIREYCKKLFLTGENDKMTPLPTYYLIFDAFIVNNNGKIDRKKMREEAMKRLSI